MNKNSKDFTNELGNEIHLELSEEEIGGINGIKLFIAGPTSDTELHVTRIEAEVIHHELGKLMGEELPIETS